LEFFVFAVVLLLMGTVSASWFPIIGSKITGKQIAEVEKEP